MGGRGGWAWAGLATTQSRPSFRSSSWRTGGRIRRNTRTDLGALPLIARRHPPRRSGGGGRWGGDSTLESGGGRACMGRGGEGQGGVWGPLSTRVGRGDPPGPPLLVMGQNPFPSLEGGAAGLLLLRSWGWRLRCEDPPRWGGGGGGDICSMPMGQEGHFRANFRGSRRHRWAVKMRAGTNSLRGQERGSGGTRMSTNEYGGGGGGIWQTNIYAKLCIKSNKRHVSVTDQTPRGRGTSVAMSKGFGASHP